jgi:hypothetical protein
LGELQFEASLGKYVQDPISKNYQSKMDWRSGSSGRVPALKVQNLEFES